MSGSVKRILKRMQLRASPRGVAAGRQAAPGHLFPHHRHHAEPHFRCEQPAHRLEKRVAIRIHSAGGVWPLGERFDRGDRERSERLNSRNSFIYAIYYSGGASDSPEGQFALERLAEPTGGRSFNVTAFRTWSRSSTRSRKKCAPVLRRVRILKLRVSLTGLKVQTRQGYYTAAR